MAERVVHELENRLGLFGLGRQWIGDTLRLNGTSGTTRGMTGEIEVTDKEIRVTLTLTPALRPMQATLEASLERFLVRLLP